VDRRDEREKERDDLAKTKGTKKKPLKLSPDIWIITGINGQEKKK
jgi:hypothetical protein